MSLSHMNSVVRHRVCSLAACTRRIKVVQRVACKAEAISRRDALLGSSLLATSIAGAARANPPSLDSDFIAETRTLAAAIDTYMSLDPFDKERIKALNFIKSEGKTWISRHAKGGSAPGQAAKRMYIAVDAVVGHLTANGAAPLPSAKVKFVKQCLKEVEDLLEQGK